MNKFIKFLKREYRYYHLKNMDKSDYPNFLENEYKKQTGYNLDLSNPQTYTEKMQYSKLYKNDDPLKTLLTDKLLVRDWVADKIGDEFLIPLLGAWDNYKEIDFDVLPDQFVLKTNHSSGWNLIVKDKNDINHFKEKIRFTRWINKEFAYINDLQLHYKDIEPKIIAEKYMEDSNGKLNDFKFLCFDGNVYYCWVDVGRHERHYRNVYNLDWELQPWTQHTYGNAPYSIEKPKNFERMVEIAKKLAEGFSHVRVDLYNVDGNIYFGEMTFTNSGGYELIYPEEYNYKLGELWNVKHD